MASRAHNVSSHISHPDKSPLLTHQKSSLSARFVISLPDKLYVINQDSFGKSPEDARAERERYESARGLIMQRLSASIMSLIVKCIKPLGQAVGLLIDLCSIR